MSGKGIERNCEEALYGYKKGSETKWNSPEIAIEKLARLYRKGDCVVRDLSTAYKYYVIYNRVARHGNNYSEIEELNRKITNEEILRAEKEADNWLRISAPDKRF